MTDEKNKVPTNKDEEMKAKVEQRGKHEGAASSDVYGNVEKDPETCVEIPTEDSVEEAKEWVDKENIR